MDFKRDAPIRTECEGVPVYSYGYTYVYGVSPEFIKGTRLQLDNDAPITKLQPRKSWEIGRNMLGVSPPRMPRTALNDFQPQLSIHLIDGDPDTFWCSRPQNRPDVEPVWIRIDLAKESLIQKVVLIPREDNLGMPTDFSIQASCDAWHWETVFEDHAYALPDNTQPRVFAFEPKRAKQIWIVARILPPVYYGTYSFSIAGVEIIDRDGQNLALVSKGAGATVSSTHYGIPSQRELHDMLWPTFYDLGMKWVRCAYWGDVLNWHFVEREQKGKYVIDPRADEVISECAQNGVNVVLGLGHTNWLYAPEGRRDPKEAKQFWETQEPWYGSLHGARGTLPATTIPGMREGFLNYVRFMVRYFKDRVKYFEVWNEENVCWNDENECACPRYFPSPKDYFEWLRGAIQIIREEAPDAKVVLGGMCPSVFCAIDIEFLRELCQDGLAPLIDVVAWHPPNLFPTEDRSDYAQMRIYENQVAEVRKLLASHGFHGEIHANEWGVSAPYPAPPGARALSELVKAKYAARIALMHHGLGIISCWCEPWNEQESWDIGLFRNTFAADPVSPQQPQPAYYVMRTLCTVLENVTPCPVDITFSLRTARFKTVGLKRDDGEWLLAIWTPEKGRDDFADIATDVTIPGAPFRQATGIDVLNGTEQPLQVNSDEGKTILPGLLIKDYPIIIRLR